MGRFGLSFGVGARAAGAAGATGRGMARALSAQEKARLPIAPYDPGPGAGGEEGKEGGKEGGLENGPSSIFQCDMRECCICLSDFERTDLVRKLPCGHLFHSEVGMEKGGREGEKGFGTYYDSLSHSIFASHLPSLPPYLLPNNVVIHGFHQRLSSLKTNVAHFLPPNLLPSLPPALPPALPPNHSAWIAGSLSTLSAPYAKPTFSTSSINILFQKGWMEGVGEEWVRGRLSTSSVSAC